jgi:thiol-disulfide isomerase/thioredoxin
MPTTQPKLKLYDFHAPWCGPCAAMKPILKKVAEAHPDVEIVKVNVDTLKGEQIASRYRVMALPTFFVTDHADKKLTRARSGTQTVEEITKMITAAKAAQKEGAE